MRNRLTPHNADLLDDNYANLALYILRDAVIHDSPWLWADRNAVAFWCDVAGIEPAVFYQRLTVAR